MLLLRHYTRPTSTANTVRGDRETQIQLLVIIATIVSIISIVVVVVVGVPFPGAERAESIDENWVLVLHKALPC